MIVAAVGATAGACAPATPHWVKPGVTAAQLERDRDDCLARSQEYLPGEAPRPDYLALERCMASKGYSATSAGR